MNHQSFYKSLFEPRAIAFIGASTNPAKWGFNILHHIIKAGYKGSIYPINPQGGTWFGRPMYKSLAEAPRPIDLAIIVVPKERVPDTLRECIDADIHAAVIITAGFGETGAEGKTLEMEVLAIARAGGIRIVGPNTMGVFSAYPSPLQAVMTASKFKQGSVAVVTQSGNLGTSISYRFLRRDIGISRLISSGNEADLMIEDYLEYLETDDMTRVICLYVEGVRQGRRFIETIRRISAVKPVILLKGGTGAIGADAAMSHTGALAGPCVVRPMQSGWIPSMRWWRSPDCCSPSRRLRGSGSASSRREVDGVSYPPICARRPAWKFHRLMNVWSKCSTHFFHNSGADATLLIWSRRAKFR